MIGCLEWVKSTGFERVSLRISTENFRSLSNFAYIFLEVLLKLSLKFVHLHCLTGAYIALGFRFERYRDGRGENSIATTVAALKIDMRDFWFHVPDSNFFFFFF